MIRIIIAIITGIIRFVTGGVRNVLEQSTQKVNESDEEYAEKNYHLSLFLQTQQIMMQTDGNKIIFKNDGQRSRYINFVFGAIDQLSRTIKGEERREIWAETSMLAHATLTFPVDDALSACKVYGQAGSSELHTAGERGFYAMNTYILASVGRASKEEFSRSSTEMYDVVTQYA